MCGIVAYIGSDNATEILLDGLRRLEYRGYDSAGIALLNGKGAELYRTEGKLINLEREVLRHNPKGHVGLGHTRWATHGKPIMRNAHPHRAGKTIVAHNGIIENYDLLRKNISKRSSLKFLSETDTEVIAHLVDYYDRGSKNYLQAIKKALGDLEGTYAVCILNEANSDKLYVAKKGSPLVIGIGKNAHYVASDVPALLPYTRQVIFLEDGEYGVLTSQSVKLFDQNGKPIKRKPKQITWDLAMAEKGGFRHFMLKEIYEQPTAVTQTFAGRLTNQRKKIDLEGMTSIFPDRHFPYDRMYAVACGTSYHAAMIGKYLIERLVRIPVMVDQGSEFRYRDPLIDRKTLLITISQSGETADTLAAIEMARKKKAKILSICNVIDSSIARASHTTLYTHAGPEIGVASTKAFVTQLLMLVLIALEAAYRFRKLDQAGLGRCIDELMHLPAKLREVIALDETIKSLARRYTGASSFLYFGRGIHYPIALEGALKLKEISYIHAEGYSAGEMKHGPIALIDKGMPVLVLAQKDERTYEKVLSNIEEVRSRGAHVIAVATEGDRLIAEKADTVLFVPKVPWFLQPIVEVVPLQLLAYHIADLKGTDVDQPRNLAKSVTVE
jgi:glutamine---fructose-6-phosphate transaminase (isomerizing)